MGRIFTYTEIKVGRLLSRYHQYKKIIEYVDYVPDKTNQNHYNKKHWYGGIYFHISDFPLANYNDEDHPYPITVRVTRPIKCLQCIKDVSKITLGELFNAARKEIEPVCGKYFIPRGPRDFQFFHWLARNGFAFIDTEYDQDKNALGDEIILPYKYIRTHIKQI